MMETPNNSQDDYAKQPCNGEKKMSHTPGPWLIDDSDTPLLILRDSPEKLLIPKIIAKVFSQCRVEDEGVVIDEGYANAKLIAAAPRLLEALQFALGRLKIVELESDYDHRTFHQGIAIDKAIAAINRATGKQA
jgi:hypothetical protein